MQKKTLPPIFKKALIINRRFITEVFDMAHLISWLNKGYQTIINNHVRKSLGWGLKLFDALISLDMLRQFRENHQKYVAELP